MEKWKDVVGYEGMYQISNLGNIKRLKEEYIMLQNASDEVEEELQQRIDKAIEYIENETTYSDYKEMDTLINILRGEDKE